MTSGIRTYPPTDRTDGPAALRAADSGLVAGTTGTVSRPLGVVVAHCIGRAPGHRCYRLSLPGFSSCPLGHALVPYSEPWIGLQTAV